MAGCPGATAASDSFVIGAAAAGVTVVVTAWAVCPGAGGCTVTVVVLPFLSTETTCCACPVAAACFFAASIAASSFDLHPTSNASASAIAPAPCKNFPEIIRGPHPSYQILQALRATAIPEYTRPILRC